MKKALLKLRIKTGFSLAETLVAVAILAIISASALPAAMRVYQNAVDAANAQVLLTTTVNALRSELATAVEVDGDTADTTAIKYKSSGVDHGSKIYVDSSTKSIMLEQYGSVGEKWLEGDSLIIRAARPLISPSMGQTTRSGDEYMKVTYNKASVQNGYIKIDGLHVERDDKTIAEIPEETGLLIRVMSVKTVPTGG